MISRAQKLLLRKKLSYKQSAFIYGSLLGDGCIKINKKHLNGNAYFSAGQTNKQYLEFQYSLMKSFVNAPVYDRIDRRPNRKKFYSFRTISHSIFTKIYKLIYPKGLKTVSNDWLQKLTPFSLAIWYMDDGSMTQSNHMMRISTESFTYKENQLISEYLIKKWDIHPNIIRSPREGRFLLKFPSEERNKFFSLVEKLILPSMKYKLDFDYKNKSQKHWTSLEKRFLRENYLGTRVNWDKMTAMLNHSKLAIGKKASVLRFANRK
ncbi:MAG TPA: LAGLIDADG endonuclease [Patescibacteria group bacterium]|nr:LAGLIDADG endonuclease [Patescibacteria group bacterium]